MLRLGNYQTAALVLNGIFCGAQNHLASGIFAVVTTLSAICMAALGMMVAVGRGLVTDRQKVTGGP